MATIQRPLKTYGNRTYVAEVAAAPSNQDPILASEVDGDIDTMYTAWNGGADTVNIKDGAISRVKLSTTDVLPSLPPVPTAADANRTVVVNSAGNGLILGTGGTFAGPTPPPTPQVGQLWWRSDPDGNLFIYYDDGNSKQFVPAVPSSVGPWSVSGATVTPTDATKTVTIPAGPSSVTFGSRTTKGHLIAHPTFDGVYFGFNTCINAAGSAWVQDDAAKASWMFGAQTDQFYVSRQPAGGALAQLLTLDNAGNLSLTGTSLVVGQRAQINPTTNNVYIWANTPGQVGFDSARNQWAVDINYNANGFTIFRSVPGTTSTWVSMLAVSGATSPPGDLSINGATATKASGTTWANPSDIRLKKNITQYARGLAEILQLEPISYTLKQHDIDTCGFDAEKVRAIFPECVGTTKMKVDPDDEEETEVLTLDIHPILIALVNAVKELAGKVGQ